MERENKLIPNSTQIPNILSDLIEPRIGEGEIRCLRYICRRTYGFHKERDRISLSQFTNGIKNSDGEQLDYGAGLSRPSVVEALKNLVGSNLVKVISTPRGNYYEINLDLFKNTSPDGVVKEVNQLRKLTKSGKEAQPKQVKLLNPQKKGNKEKQSIINVSPQDLELANLLYKRIKDQNPAWYLKPDIDSWAEDIRKLREIDGRTEEQIRWMIEWTQKNEFWKTNILSPAKLRKQFNTLVIQAKNGNGKGKEIIGL